MSVVVPLKYTTGEEIRLGDSVMCSMIEGRIVQVLLANTEQAHWHDCDDTGGVLIELFNGDCQLWTRFDEDLLLRKRQ